jgi:pseudouridine kinase
MTDREKEILLIIQKDPCISQEAISDILGITRSSVAVHISNLTKKGFIKGRGYIIDETPYTVVIGGSNMDIIGTPLGPIIEKDSNIGKVITRSGGVGRNICTNLSRLGVSVHFISAVGNDAFGKRILEELGRLGIERSGISVQDAYPTSTYLCINDHQGDMALAISHMDIASTINIAYLTELEQKIEGASALIVDTNLSSEALDYLLHKYHHKAIFIDPVSTKKAIKLRDLLPYITFIKPNLIEAACLVDVARASDQDDIGYAKTLAEALVKAGVKEVAITLSEQGVVYADQKETTWYANYPVRVVNTTGAGDAFFSGYVSRALKKEDCDAKVCFALACAAYQVSREDASVPMNETVINHLMTASSV